MDRADVYTKIRKERPDLAESSVRTYTSNVLRVGRAINGSAFNKNAAKIPELFKNKSIAVQKGLTVACLVWCRAAKKPHDKLEEQLKTLDAAVREQVNKQQPSEKERKNWTSMAKLKKMLTRMKEDIKNRSLYTADPLPPRERAMLQAYTILAFMIKGPLRLDAADVRLISAYKYKQLKTTEKEAHNWYITGAGTDQRLHLYRFKTAKHFARKDGGLPLRIALDKQDKATFNAWIKTRARQGFEHDWMFVNVQGGKMSRNSLSKLISATTRRRTGKVVGSTLLRHVFLSNYLGNERALEQKLATARRMGQTNITQQTQYRKLL